MNTKIKWYSTTILIPFGKLDSILNWCKDNCNDNWKFFTGEFTTTNNVWLVSYEFQFESDKDYMAFMLWNK